MNLQEKHERIRESGRNFNEEWMVSLWQEYHGKKSQTFKFLYYDEKV